MHTELPAEIGDGWPSVVTGLPTIVLACAAVKTSHAVRDAALLGAEEPAAAIATASDAAKAMPKWILMDPLFDEDKGSFTPR
jgi:hypothetical protein